VAADANSCEYCSAALLVKACPHCFARIFHGYQHCSACGSALDVPAIAAPNGEIAPRRCPRCAEFPALVAQLVGDVLLDECDQCGGVWVDRRTVEHIVNDRREQSFEAIFGWGNRAKASVPAAGAQVGAPGRVYLRCPDCGDVMNRVNFARHSGIVVDVCREHGTWFDRDELPAMVSYVRQGGLDKTHSREAENLAERARRSQQVAAHFPVDGDSGRHSWTGEIADAIFALFR
jgi:Zn-finger nucleic acid-binding protein